MRQSQLFTRLKHWFLQSGTSGQRIARVASGVVILISCMVLLGWALEISALKTMVIGGGTMRANAALGLLLSGISLGLLARSRSNFRTVQTAIGCAILAGAIGGLTLIQHFTGFNFGIDELLFRDPFPDPPTLPPGRMGLLAAVNLSLISVALWLSSRGESFPHRASQLHSTRTRTCIWTRIWIAQNLAAVVAVIALQSAVVRAYGLPLFSLFDSYITGMGAQTAVAFGLLSIGVLALRGDRGWMRTVTSPDMGGIVVRRFLPMAIVLPLVLGWLVLQGDQANWYAAGYGVAVMAIALVVASVVLLVRSGSRLNRLDYDRKRSLDRLRSSEARLELAQTTTDMGTWEWNIQTGELWWSETCYAVLGVSPTETDLLGAFMASVDPEDLPQVETVVQNRDLITTVELEYRYHHPERGLRWIYSRAAAAADNPAVLRGLSFDITDRKQAERDRALDQETIQQQLAEIEAIYHTAPVGLAILDCDLRFVRLNQQLAEMNGFPIEAHLGRTVREVLPQVADAVEPLFRRVLETGEPLLNLELNGETVSQPGVQRTWIENWYPLRDAAGQIIGINAVVQEITDRKRAETALQEATQKITTIWESMSDAYTTLDREWRIVYANRTALQVMCHLSGLEPEEILGKTHWEVLPWTVGQPLEQEYRRAMAEQVPVHLEVLYEPTGDWFEINAYPSSEGLGLYYRDISDRKINQLNDQFLNDLDAQLRHLNDVDAMKWEVVSRLGAYLNVDRALWNQTDWENGWITINQDWRREGLPSHAGTYPLANFASPELQAAHAAGQPLIVSDVTTDPQTAAYVDTYQSLNIGALISYPCIYEGRWAVVLSVNTTTARPWQDYEISLIHDITTRLWTLIEQTRAVQALRQSEDRFRTLANNISQFAWTADVSGWIDWYNQRWFDYTGTTLEEMQGWGWQTVYHPDHVNRVVEGFRHCIETGEAWEDTFPLRGRDGQYRWFLSRAIPIRDAQGNILRWFGTNTDITDRKQTEEELTQLNRLKDEFLAALSHELRTPLNPILGWTKMMQSQRLTPAKTTEALDIIERNVKQQIALVDDLLDISRVIQGKLKLKLQPIDLASIVQNAIDTVQFAAQAKQIKIEVYPYGALPVIGDRDRLQQIFWNLLNNAIKFTPAGGRVTVNCSVNQNGNEICDAEICIQDNGIGISSEFLPYVFDRFRQADGSETRGYGGLGLGLSIVKHLVELHGGTITVASAGMGQGATFTVRLPLSTGSAGLTTERIAPSPVELAPRLQWEWTDESASTPLVAASPGLMGVQILLVDDDHDNLDLLRFLLQAEGATVTALTSPQAALNYITQTPPDLIVSDVGMPQMTGYELMRQVRALPQGGQIPALALTAFARTEDQAKALASGFQAYITKPVDPIELLSTLTQLVQA